MANRTPYQPRTRQYQVTDAPLDEDAIPATAAMLAAVTNPVPVGPAERPWARAGQVAWRAAMLAAMVVLAYLPVLLAPALLDGEADAYAHQPPPDLAWADYRQLPAALVTPPPHGPPTFLRVLLHQESRLGNGPLTHHVSGVVLHAAVTVVLWLVLRRLNRPGAWLAAALFAVNPGSAAAVEWLGLRGRPWGALLALAGCWLLLRGVGVPPVVSIDPADFDPDEQPRGWRRWASAAVAPLSAMAGLGLLLAATYAKPTVAAVGLVAVVLVAWRRGLRVWDVLWTVPVVALAAAAAAAAARTPLPPGMEPAVAALSRVQQAMWWTGRAVERVAWPLASADLVLAGTRAQVLTTCGVGGAFWAAVVVLIVARRWVGSGPGVTVVCATLLLPTMWVPTALRPVPGLTAARQAAAAGTYLVAIPALVVLADLIVAAAQRVRVDLTRRVTEVAAAAAAVVALGCVTAVRANAFDDTETILKTAVRVNGRSWDDRSRLAEWYLTQHRPDPAFDVMTGLTLENCPDAAAADAQGDLLAADGNLTGAMAWYQRAAVLAPGNPEPIGRQSQALVAMNRVGDAVDLFERAIAEHPASAPLRYTFGLLLRDLKNLPLAEEQFRRAVALDPEVADEHVALAAALADQGHPDQAAVELQEAVRLDPENFDAFHDAGLILLRLGADDRAARMLHEAVRLRPESPVARSDLAVALIKLRKFKSADFELTEALRLQPGYPPAVSNLAVERRLALREQQRANVEGK